VKRGLSGLIVVIAFSATSVGLLLHLAQKIHVADLNAVPVW
jgi:hypothetical protein